MSENGHTTTDPSSLSAEPFAPLSEEHLHFVEGLAPVERAVYNMSKLAASNIVLRDYAEREAKTDHLTGIPNGREFEKELQTAIQDGKPFGVVRFDLDNFKWVNDHLGYDEGDKALQEFAASLRGTVRRGDTLTFIARDGGDEFWGIFPLNAHKERGEDHKPQERFAKALHRIQLSSEQFVKEHPEWNGPAARFGVSMGGAMWIAEKPLSEEALRQAADISLKKSKMQAHAQNGSYR